jgi:ribosomal protein S20
MHRKITSLSSTLWLVAAVVAITGLAAFSLVSAVVPSEQTQEPNKMPMAEGKKMEKMPMCTMEDMHKCTNMCVKNCQANMENISSAKDAIKAAMEAIDKGDMKAAKSELEKADKLLATVHKTMEESMDKMPCVNNKCPISGKSIDMMDRPKDCTRMYKWQKVGFCCTMCPATWDKLTDAEKDAKLKGVLPPKEKE